MPTIKPFGRWPSPLNTADVARSNIKYGEPKLAGRHVFWPQSLPHEGGRTTLMCCDLNTNESPTLNARTLLGAPWDVRSKVHEYGGGAFAVNAQSIFFVNSADQQIYTCSWQDDAEAHTAVPQALTNTPNSRYADLVVHPNGEWLLAICETFHTDTAHPSACVVAIETKPSTSLLAPLTITEGHDFYPGLCVAPSGSKLAYIAWQHPNMPWDTTSLWQHTWQNGAAGPAQLIINSSTEAVVQPGYSQSGKLYYMSDRNNWWNLYCEDQPTEPVIAMKADCATPQWTFGMKNWGFTNNNTLLMSYSQDGRWHLAKTSLDNPQLLPISPQLSVFSHLDCQQGSAALLAAGPNHTLAPAKLTDSELQFLQPNNLKLNNSDISQPQSHWFNTSRHERAHLWFYPPTNQQAQGPEDRLPPLILLGHGGPTGATDTGLNAKIQYWTTRGFAVADVNYRGSTGFGRHYRQSLQKNWGLLDVDDLCFAAQFLVAQGLVHPHQKIIKGSSAGGYSVLAALTQHRTFDAGVCFYGVADLHALAADTHKFEAHYLDSLIGPYATTQQEYSQRSPINHIANLYCPLLVAQGLDDKVVPPAQAQQIVDAAKHNGIAVDYLTFEGEGHGFRKTETLITLYQREYQFYCQALSLGSDH